MQDFLALLEMVLRIFEVSQSPQIFLVLVILSFARLVTFFSIVPFFGGAVISARVKVAVAAAFVIILYPSIAAIPENQTFSFGVLGFTALLTKEILVGFTLGFIASLVFEAVQIAGRIVDYQRGAMTAELYAPSLETHVSELGQFKLWLAVVLFIAVGAHRLFIGALLRSYEFIPALTFPNFTSARSPAAVELIAQLAAAVFSIGLQIAAPVIVALLLTDLLFGILNRTAPQINVFFLAMPVKMLIGVLIVLIALPFIASRMTFYFGETYRAFEYAIRMMAGAN